MRVLSTCVACGQALEVTTPGQTLHRSCDPPPGSIEALTAHYLAMVTNGHDAEQLADVIDAYDRRTPQLRQAALAYAAWGWPVFPCAPGHKTPLVARGFHQATTDTRQITRWWQRTPTANVGVATGHRFDVIDVDPGGYHAWADLRDHADHTIHGQVSTPRGGLHAYIAPTGGGNLAGFAPGLDYRGKGGYVLLPPSVLVPAAIKGDLPPWPLAYSWWTRPSPALTHAQRGEHQ